MAYDPAYAYETAVIVQDGLRRMYVEDESIFYYITLYNEDYAMPAMPAGSAEGILKGMYQVASPRRRRIEGAGAALGSGPILRQVLAAQEILAEDYKIASDVWSVTSYKELRREALEVERWNLLHPTKAAHLLCRGYAGRTARARSSPPAITCTWFPSRSPNGFPGGW